LLSREEKTRHLKQLKEGLEELVLENLPLLVEAEEDLELDEDVTGLPSRARTRAGSRRSTAATCSILM